LDCFDYNLVGEKAINLAKITPKVVINTENYIKEELITYNDTTCFAENRHILKGGSFVMDFAPSVYICLEGEAEIIGDNYNRKIEKGDYFFLPYIAEGKFKVQGNAVLIECLPSKQD